MTDQPQIDHTKLTHALNEIAKEIGNEREHAQAVYQRARAAGLKVSPPSRGPSSGKLFLTVELTDLERFLNDWGL
jgi:hypothetical protein